MKPICFLGFGHKPLSPTAVSMLKCITYNIYVYVGFGANHIGGRVGSDFSLAVPSSFPKKPWVPTRMQTLHASPCLQLQLQQ